MSAQESSLTFALDGGINTSALEDTVQPPALLESDNTRLSVVRGTLSAAPATEVIKSVTAGAECLGIVPAGHFDSAVAFFHQGGGMPQRVAGDSATLLESTLNAGIRQNAYIPTEIAKAGTVPGSLELRAPVVCVYEGMRFYASVRPNPFVTNGFALYVTVLDADARIVIAPTLVAVLGVETVPGDITNIAWVGLSSHSPNGVRVWYQKAQILYRRTLTVTGLVMTVGAEVSHSGTGAALAHEVDVVGNDPQFAWLLHQNTGNTASLLHKVDILADTYASTTMAQYASFRPVAISLLRLASAPYLAITYRSSAQWFKSVFRADTMVEQWNTMSTLNAAGEEVGVQFLVESNGDAYGVFAITKIGQLSSLSPTFVLFETRNLFTGTLDRQISQNWMRLQDRGATVTLNALEHIPVFTLERCYNYIEAADFEPDSAHWGLNALPDPSLELYTVSRGAAPRLMCASIARFGVDTVLRGRSEIAGVPACMGSNTATVDGLRVIVTYLAENFIASRSALGHVPRFVEVDFTPKQPRFAIASSGVALVAAAQPATWDGVELVEAGPLHQPRTRAYPTGGVGPTLSSGRTYWRVVYSWRDSAGELHRSPPSLPEYVDHLAAPGESILYVTVPDTLRDGRSQEEFDVTVYQSDDGIEYWSRIDYVPSNKADVWKYDNITEDIPKNATLLYSTGQEGEQLFAEAPPPMWDAAYVGPRGWAIHGEFRARAVYSKRREEGIATEWNSSLYFDFPAAAGDLIAVTELDGKPLFFAEGGIYTIDGEGPDARGDGAPYSDPRRISQVACTRRDSVVRYAAGVLFQCGERFAVVSSGGAVQLVDEVDAAQAGLVSTAIELPTTHEVVVLSNTARAHALNYMVNRWTTWSSLAGLRCAAMTTARRMLAFDYAGHALVHVVVDDGRADVQRLVTGWIQPAGPQGDCEIREVILQGLHTGEAFSLRVIALQDFDERTDADNVALDEEYESADIVDAGNGTQRFTLRCALSHTVSRSLKLLITATRESETNARSFFRPLAITIPTGVNPGELRRHVAAGMK